MRGFAFSTFRNCCFGLIVFFLALENRAQQKAGHFLAGRIRLDFFRGVDGLFRIRPTLAFLVDLRDIELDFKIGGRTVQQGAKLCNRLIGLRVFAEQKRLCDQDGAVLGISVRGFVRGVERLGACRGPRDRCQ